MIWSFPHQIKLTFGRRVDATAPQIPLAAGKAQEDKTILKFGFSSHAGISIRPPGSAETDRGSVDCLQSVLKAPFRHLFTMAPSMTTPAVAYFHSATGRLRASATIVVFRRRPPFR